MFSEGVFFGLRVFCHWQNNIRKKVSEQMFDCMYKPQKLCYHKILLT
jgi:hypothetical protein